MNFRFQFIAMTCIIFVLCAGLVYFFVRIAQDRAAIAWYTAALKDSSTIEQVEMPDGTFLVRNGVIDTTKELSRKETYATLRIAYALSASRRSAPFALPYENTEDLRRAVDLLKEAQQEISHYEQSPQNAQLVATALYPTAFLDSLADLENARRDFLSKRNEEALIVYLERLTDTTAIGAHDARVFRDALHAIVPEDSRFYLSIDRLFTPTDLRAASVALTDAFNGAVEIHAHRAACMRGKYTECTADLLNPPDIASQDATPQELPASVSAIEQFYARANGRPYTGNEEFVVLASNTCVLEDAPPYFFSLWREHPDHSPTFAIKYRNDLFFAPISTSSDETLADIISTRHNAQFLHLNPTMFYMCPTVGRDIGRARTTDLIMSFAQTHEEFAKDARKALVHNPLLLQEDLARNYLAHARSEALKTDEPKEERYALEELALAYAGARGGLTYVVEDIARITMRQSKLTEDGVRPIAQASTLFLTRHAFPSLFLAHSNSPVALDPYESPLIEAIRSYAHSRTMRFSTLRTTIGEDTLLNDLRTILTLEGDVFTSGATTAETPQ